MEDLKVRNLQTQDLYTVATIIGKCGSEAVEKIAQMAKSTPKSVVGQEKDVEGKESIEPKSDSKRDTTGIGIAVISIVLIHAKDEIKPFFASLINKSVEEYDKMPFDTTLTIVDKLSEQEDLSNFFKHALSLGKKLFSMPE